MTCTLPITQAASGGLPDQTTFRRRLTGLTCNDPSRSFGGLRLQAPQTADGLVTLIDEAGREVHRWKPPVHTGRHAAPLQPGFPFSSSARRCSSGAARS